MNDERVPKVLDQAAYDAEIKLAEAYDYLASAHGNLASTHLDYAEEFKEQCKNNAEKCFDTSEEFMREAFAVNSVHVARYSENPEPYKRALGAILECVENSYLESSFIYICKLHKIDPDDAHRSYRHWLDGGE